MANDNTLITSNNQGLRLLVKEELSKANINVIGETENCEETLFEIGRLNPDLVILGGRLTENFNFDFCQRLRNTYPGLKILVLSSANHELIVWGFLKNGANGYILENKISEELACAIQIALRGGLWVSPCLAEKMIQQALRQEDYLYLSSRETTMLKMLSEGKKDIEIARALGISERTVRNHAKQTLEKIGVNTKIQAVSWAAMHGLLE
jgi:DNA-binding NarL/FixJ family response regulator